MKDIATRIEDHYLAFISTVAVAVIICAGIVWGITVFVKRVR